MFINDCTVDSALSPARTERRPLPALEREYLVVRYLSDPAALAARLPGPLKPDGSGIVQVDFSAVHDRGSCDSWVQATVSIAAVYRGVAVNAVVLAYLDDAQPAVGTLQLPASRGRVQMLRLPGEAVGLVSSHGETLLVAVLDTSRSCERTLCRSELRAMVSKPTAYSPRVGAPDDAQCLLVPPAATSLLRGCTGDADVVAPTRADNAPAGLPVRRVIAGSYLTARCGLSTSRSEHRSSRAAEPWNRSRQSGLPLGLCA